MQVEDLLSDYYIIEELEGFVKDLREISCLQSLFPLSLMLKLIDERGQSSCLSGAKSKTCAFVKPFVSSVSNHLLLDSSKLLDALINLDA